MKAPRITDFDPNARVPELGSPLDDFPVIQPRQPSPAVSSVDVPQTSPVSSPFPTSAGQTAQVLLQQKPRISPSPKEPAMSESENSRTPEPRKPVQRDLHTQESAQAGGAAPTATPASGHERWQFDSDIRADQKYTTALTTQEMEALEDLKTELRRRFDIKTSKTDILRYGLWDLLTDYQQRGEESHLVKRLKARSRPQRT